MGMAIAYQIITQRHGGSLQCMDAPGHFVAFLACHTENFELKLTHDGKRCYYIWV
jgi:signal transduction histidine kinase